MPGKVVPPSPDKAAFTCPFCETLCTHYRTKFYTAWRQTHKEATNTWRTSCSTCHKDLLWHQGAIVHPAVTAAPLPHPDLPASLVQTFEEARNILGPSPRGAAALLRYVIDVLTKELSGLERADINERIRYLVEKQNLSPQAQQALDSVRVIGNNAVHPLEIDLTDNPKLAAKLFTLANAIVEDTITRPREIAKVYASLPQRNLAAIEKRDGEAKVKGSA